jgi:hypothetical protein
MINVNTYLLASLIIGYNDLGKKLHLYECRIYVRVVSYTEGRKWKGFQKKKVKLGMLS